MCVLLTELASIIERIPDLARPHGPAAEQIYTEQVSALRVAVVTLQRELALRGAALEKSATAPLDMRGDARRAGMAATHAAALRRLGTFTTRHPDLQHAWTTGTLGQDQLDALRQGCVQLRRDDLARQLIDLVLPVLPDLTIPQARTVIARTVDQLAPSIPDHDDTTDHAARALSWSHSPGGGITLTGYLPAPEADTFTHAIEAMTDTLRAAGDTLTATQRRADALTTLIAHSHPPTGGGLPAALTLTVSLTEATRIAARDPHTLRTGQQRRPRGDAHHSTHPDTPAGDAAIRFALCCAAVTPILHTTNDQTTRPDQTTPPDQTAQPHETAPATGRTAATASGRPAATSTPAGPSPLALLAATPTQPLAVGRAVRLATPAQRQALRLRDRGCAIPGCGVNAAHTHPHHVTPWNLDGPTDLDNLVSLCWVHHRQTELGHWTFQPKLPNQQPPHRAYEHARWWIIPPGPVINPHTDRRAS